VTATPKIFQLVSCQPYDRHVVVSNFKIGWRKYSRNGVIDLNNTTKIIVFFILKATLQFSNPTKQLSGVLIISLKK